MTDGLNVPSGWYPDELRPGWARWWDGRQWTDHWAPLAAPTPPPTWSSTPAPSWTTPQPVVPVVPVVPAGGRPRTAIVLAVLGIVVLVVAAGSVIWSVTRTASAGGSGDAASGGQGSGQTASPSDDTAEGTEVGPEPSDEPTPEGNDSGRLVDTCGASELLSIPGTDVFIEPMSLDQEIEIGEDTRTLVFETYATSTDTATQSVLTELLTQLRPPASAVPYSVTLLDSSEVNAFATPGGAIYFTSAIAERMTEDELAFVLAHEIAHVECRHLAQQFEREALVAAGLSVVLGQEVDADDLYANAATGMLTNLASLSFSRADEAESDLAAIDLMESAGRPLDAAVDAMQVLFDLEGVVEPSRVDVLLSTHPPTQERIDALEAAISSR